MVSFNYRRIPAVMLAKQLVDEGRLGRIFHYRAKYLQDWTISPDLPQGGNTLWRLDAQAAGSGVTGDLLAHSIDLAQWLAGPIAQVTAMTETFITERPLQDEPGTVMPVGIDDACAFLARFENGALGTFESTRYASGRKNQNTFEINGELGSIAFDLEDAHQLQYYDRADDVTDARLPHHLRVGQRPSVYGPLVGARLRHRLRAHVYPPVVGFSGRAWSTARSACRTSATATRRSLCAMPCWRRRGRGRGRR